MYSVVVSPPAARDIRRLVSQERAVVQQAIALLKNRGLESPHAHRVVQTGRPGLFSLRVSDQLRLFASPLDPGTIALLAVARRTDFDRIATAAREATAAKLPAAQLQAAANILQGSANTPDEEIHERLKEAAPQVVSFAESTLKDSENWNAVAAIGTWIGVIISLIALLVALAEGEREQNFYINVEQIIEVEEEER